MSNMKKCPFPDELIKSHTWINWRLKRKTKVPVHAETGKMIGVNNRAAWSAYEVASEKLHGGLGFVFSGCGIVGVDLDDCVDSEGNVSDFAFAVLSAVDTYAELSPSKTGLHLFYRVRKKITEDFKKEFCEFYSDGRYFTMTGDALPNRLHGLAEVEDMRWLLEIYSHHFRNFDKAVNEISSGPITHNRNNTLFAYASLLRAKDLHKDEIAALVMARYQNDVVSKKDFPVSEVTALIDSATRYTADESHATEVLRQTSAVIQVPPSLIHDAPGPIGQLLRDIYSSAAVPNAASTMAGVLAAVGTLLGRSIASKESDMRTNVYSLCLVEKGAGKDHPKKMLKSVFDRAGLFPHFSVSDVTSDAAVYSVVRERSPACLLLDEIGVILRNAGRSSGPAVTITKAMLTMYNEANEKIDPKAYAGRDEEPITDAHLCIYGLATQEQMIDALSSSTTTDGLFARMMVFSSTAAEDFQESPSRFDASLWGEVFKETWKRSKINTKAVYERTLLFTNTPGLMQYSRELRKRNSGCLVRMHEHVRKIYMLAVGMGAGLKESEEWAIKVTDHLCTQALYWHERGTANGQYDRYKNDIVNALEQNKGELKESLLTMHTGHIPRHVRTSIIQDLLESKVLIKNNRHFFLNQNKSN